MSTGAGLLSKTLRTTETLSLHVKATFRQLSLGNQTWWHWWCRAIWECTLLTPFLQIADFLQTAAHFLLSHQTQFPTSVLLTYFCLYVFYFFFFYLTLKRQGYLFMQRTMSLFLILFFLKDSSKSEWQTNLMLCFVIAPKCQLDKERG